MVTIQESFRTLSRPAQLELIRELQRIYFTGAKDR